MMADLLFFMSIFMVFLLGYGIVSESLFQSALVKCGGSTAEEYSISQVFARPYWSVMGELGLDEFAKLADDSSACRFARYWLFPGLLALYTLICSILLLNLLIAIFSSTFAKVEEEALQLWAFNRYELILEYRQGLLKLTMDENKKKKKKKNRQNSLPIIHCPTSEGVSEVSERANE